MVKDLPPEERLLRLIRGTHKRDNLADEKPKKPETSNQRPKGVPSENEGKPDAETQKEKPELKKATAPISIGVKEERLDPFKVTIILLIGLFAIGILYFSYELFGQKRQPPIIDIEKLISPETKPAEEKPVEEKKPITKEEEEMPPEIRELFGAPVTRETPPLIEEGPSISELARDLVLVGAITGDNPQAIIQDKRTRQTFYVYEGESVLEFKIKKIEKAVVILEHNGETIKLSL